MLPLLSGLKWEEIIRKRSPKFSVRGVFVYQGGQKFELLIMVASEGGIVHFCRRLSERKTVTIV